jgi:hypothetical protein
MRGNSTVAFTLDTYGHGISGSKPTPQPPSRLLSTRHQRDVTNR